MKRIAFLSIALLLGIYVSAQQKPVKKAVVKAKVRTETKAPAKVKAATTVKKTISVSKNKTTVTTTSKTGAKKPVNGKKTSVKVIAPADRKEDNPTSGRSTYYINEKGTKTYVKI